MAQRSYLFPGLLALQLLFVSGCGDTTAAPPPPPPPPPPAQSPPAAMPTRRRHPMPAMQDDSAPPPPPPPPGGPSTLEAGLLGAGLGYLVAKSGERTRHRDRNDDPPPWRPQNYIPIPQTPPPAPILGGPPPWIPHEVYASGVTVKWNGRLYLATATAQMDQSPPGPPWKDMGPAAPPKDAPPPMTDAQAQNFYDAGYSDGQNGGPNQGGFPPVGQIAYNDGFAQGQAGGPKQTVHVSGNDITVSG